MRRLAIVVVLAAAVGCVSSSKYQTKEKEAAALDAQTKEQAAKIAALEKKSTELEQQVAQLEEQRQQLEVKTAALSQEKGQLEAKSAQYEKLAQSLQGQIKAGQIEISELRGKMMVKLKDKILFPSGSARLSAAGKAALDQVAGAFAGLEGKNIVVAGYTDDVPVGKATGFADNWDLSAARAVAVVRYLASKGINPQALGAAGFSQYRPIVANSTADGRSQNRRIEIVLTAADYQPPEVDAAAAK
jgi:chemotaxis protein MotB